MYPPYYRSPMLPDFSGQQIPYPKPQPVPKRTSIKIIAVDGKSYDMPWAEDREPTINEKLDFIDKANPPKKGILGHVKDVVTLKGPVWQGNIDVAESTGLNEAIKNKTATSIPTGVPGLSLGPGAQKFVQDSASQMTSIGDIILSAVGVAEFKLAARAASKIPEAAETIRALVNAKVTGNTAEATRLATELNQIQKAKASAEMATKTATNVGRGFGATLAGTAAAQGIRDKDPSQILPFALGAAGAAYRGPKLGQAIPPEHLAIPQSIVPPPSPDIPLPQNRRMSNSPYPDVINDQPSLFPVAPVQQGITPPVQNVAPVTPQTTPQTFNRGAGGRFAAAEPPYFNPETAGMRLPAAPKPNNMIGNRASRDAMFAEYGARPAEDMTDLFGPRTHSGMGDFRQGESSVNPTGFNNVDNLTLSKPEDITQVNRIIAENELRGRAAQSAPQSAQPVKPVSSVTPESPNQIQQAITELETTLARLQASGEGNTPKVSAIRGVLERLVKANKNLGEKGAVGKDIGGRPPRGPKKPATNLTPENIADVELWYKFKKLHDSGEMTDRQMTEWAKIHNKVKDLKPDGTFEIKPNRFDTLPIDEPEFTPYILPDGTRVNLSTSATKGAETTTFQLKGGEIVTAKRATDDLPVKKSDPYDDYSRDFDAETSGPIKSVDKLDQPGIVKPISFEDSVKKTETSLPVIKKPEGPTLGSGFGALQGLPYKQIGQNLGKLGQDVKKRPLDYLNVPRSIQASVDVSAPFRQGAFLLGKKEFWKSFSPMFKALTSETEFKKIESSIRANKKYSNAVADGIKFTELDAKNIGKREEQFSSSVAEQIPLLGKYGIRPSSRAFNTFINKLRMDTYSSLIDDANNLGLKTSSDAKLRRQIAEFVNSASGRGSLEFGKFGEHHVSLEPAATALNATFFSPRLAASRLGMLANSPISPYLYMSKEPFVRKQYLKSWLAFTGAIGTTVGLTSLIPGVKVETEPTNPDFMKIKIGKTRLDPWGGVQQYVRVAAQLSTGTKTSSITGRVTELNTGKFGSPTQGDVLLDFARSKASPIASFMIDKLSGKDFKGQDFSYRTGITNRLTPMIANDLYELAQEDPKLIPLIIPASFGWSLQTYRDDPFKKGTKSNISSVPRIY